MVGLFTFAIFLSAMLLFGLQPMAGRLMLPSYGGSPTVWTTSLLFFQCTLLAGYLYAHGLARLREARMQVAVHIVLLAGALATLPIGPRATMDARATHAPVASLLQQLATSIGPCFFALSATGPLLQRWFASTRHASARDPYFLYAASNAGSLLALLGYPLVELAAGLKAQGRGWSIGYATFVVAAAACGLSRVRRADGDGAETAGDTAPPAVQWKTRARWLLLAFVPSTQMLGVTLFITTDVASAPLLWVVPLALYLLTFVLAFAQRTSIPIATLGTALTLLVLALSATFLFRWSRPLWLILALHLAALFVGAWMCHARLAAERPHPRKLTEFYLLLATGGALGGIFGGLVGPRLFDAVLEYPIALALALSLQPARSAGSRRRTALDVAVPLAGLLLFVALVAAVRASAPRLIAAHGTSVMEAVEIAVTALPLIVLASAFRRPRRLALSFAAVVFIAQTRLASSERVLHAERTFFGIHRVSTDAEGRWRRLSHGTTRHGVQYADPRLSFRPMMYYHPTGPIGDVFRVLADDPEVTRIGVIGLGAGTLAAYAAPGRRFVFFEIDPEVVRIAERHFTYLEDARRRGADVGVVLGMPASRSPASRTEAWTCSWATPSAPTPSRCTC